MQHTLNLYQKPKRGNKFLGRYRIHQYVHTISAVGGYDTASCTILLRSRSEAFDFLEDHIGNRVAIFADDPTRPIWEGFINRMTFNLGKLAYTISLDEMFNALLVTYTDEYTTPGTPAIAHTAVAPQLTSQNIYGFKQGAIDLGIQRVASGKPNALRDTVINIRGWPQASIRQEGDGVAVSLELLGFYHTLKWQLYTNNSGSVTNSYAFITSFILPIVNNGSTYFSITDFAEITNNTTSVPRGDPGGKTLWDALRGIQESGDTTGEPYVIGVTPTDPNTGGRRLYYRPANFDIAYKVRNSDGMIFRNRYGKPIPPWLVQPDRVVRVTDALVEYGLPGDDPRDTYLNVVEYDSERQVVTGQGFDDTTMEGVLNLRNNRPLMYGKPFSGRIRFTSA